VSKVHCGSAFEPGASGLPYYCTPPVCVPDVIVALPVCRQNIKTKVVAMNGTSKECNGAGAGQALTRAQAASLERVCAPWLCHCARFRDRELTIRRSRKRAQWQSQDAPERKYDKFDNTIGNRGQAECLDQGTRRRRQRLQCRCQEIPESF